MTEIHNSYENEGDKHGDDEDVEFYFHLAESTDYSKLFGEDEKEAKGIVKLASLASRLRSTLESTGLKMGNNFGSYLEASYFLTSSGSISFSCALHSHNILVPPNFMNSL